MKIRINAPKGFSKVRISTGRHSTESKGWTIRFTEIRQV